MTSRMRVHIIYIFLLIAACLPQTASAQQHEQLPKWEQTETVVNEAVKSADGANVRVQDMHIYVELEQPQQVKLFTILGQPVSSMQLPAGTSRIRLSARGIYILKIGSTTRRITI